LKNDLEGLFRDAPRIAPSADLWRRIAERSSLAPGAEGGRTGDGSLAEGEARRAEGTGWMELRYLRAAGVVLAGGLLALAAFGLLRRPHGELMREASAAQTEASAQAEPEVFDPELLEWQADLGDYELVADQAEEVL
jgi:hypothetical protein